MTTVHLLPDGRKKKSADDSARAFWTRDVRYQECVMRPKAIVQRNATESNEKGNCSGENAIRRWSRLVRAVICKEAIRRTRSSLLKLVRRIQFQRICGSVLRFYFEQLRDICDNPHINPSVTQLIANSPAYHNKFVLMLSNIRYFESARHACKKQTLPSDCVIFPC